MLQLLPQVKLVDGKNVDQIREDLKGEDKKKINNNPKKPNDKAPTPANLEIFGKS